MNFLQRSQIITSFLLDLGPPQPEKLLAFLLLLLFVLNPFNLDVDEKFLFFLFLLFGYFFVLNSLIMLLLSNQPCYQLICPPLCLFGTQHFPVTRFLPRLSSCLILLGMGRVGRIRDGIFKGAFFVSGGGGFVGLG